MADITVHNVRTVTVETFKSGSTTWTVIKTESQYEDLPVQVNEITLFHDPAGIVAPFINAEYAPKVEHLEAA